MLDQATGPARLPPFRKTGWIGPTRLGSGRLGKLALPSTGSVSGTLPAAALSA